MNSLLIKTENLDKFLAMKDIYLREVKEIKYDITSDNFIKEILSFLSLLNNNLFVLRDFLFDNFYSEANIDDYDVERREWELLIFLYYIIYICLMKKEDIYSIPYNNISKELNIRYSRKYDEFLRKGNLNNLIYTKDIYIEDGTKFEQIVSYRQVLYSFRTDILEEFSTENKLSIANDFLSIIYLKDEDNNKIKFNEFWLSLIGVLFDIIEPIIFELIDKYKSVLSIEN